MNRAGIAHTQQEYGLRQEALEFPMMVVLSFIYICNSKCPNCPYNNSKIRADYRDALYMPEEIFKRIADECGLYRSVIRVSGGGEPMLHPKAVELMVYAKHKGARVGLITNGSTFTQKDLRELLRAGVDAIEFSVDAGDPETYARVRPGLDWETLNRNVQTAVELRNSSGSETRIITSVINQRGVDVERATKYWSSVADNVQIRKYLTWGYNKNRSADDSSYLPPEDRIPCPWLFERLNIDSRGDVTLCGEDIAFNEKFANIMHRRIKDIWQGAEFITLREKHLAGRGHEIPICSRCPDRQYRSWRYNYWKVLREAEMKRKRGDGCLPG